MVHFAMILFLALREVNFARFVSSFERGGLVCHVLSYSFESSGLCQVLSVAWRVVDFFSGFNVSLALREVDIFIFCL